MELDSRVRAWAEAWGADFCGVADLAPAREALLAQGGEMAAGLPRAVSLGIRLPDAIVDQLPRRAERAVGSSYRHHAYHVVNQRLDELASRLAGALQREGHLALPVPAALRIDDEQSLALFPHKLAAHLAGLGWIGKSCLLVTPTAGPRVRWITVLTDAPLATGQPMAERCGRCRECVDICPQQALTGRAFRADEPREARLDAQKCEQYLKELRQGGDWCICGLCLYVCPFGRRKR